MTFHVRIPGRWNAGARRASYVSSATKSLRFVIDSSSRISQVQVYDSTAARNPVNGPIPFNGTTTSCGNTYIYGSSSVVNSVRWLSNTKLLIALQAYTGSTATAQNGLYIFDISATAVPAGFDDVSCSTFAPAPKQTGFVHVTNKPLGTAFRP